MIDIAHNIFNIKITSVTPIHIGTGEIIYPWERVFAEEYKNGSPKYYAYVGKLGHSFWADFPMKKEVIQIIEKSSFNELTTFIRGEPSIIEYFKKNHSYKMQISQALYNELIDKHKDIEISSTIRSHKGFYIPGSYLKRAVKTGLIHSNVSKKTISRNPGHSKFERQLLAKNVEHQKYSISSNNNDDILRNLRIGDSTCLERSTMLHTANSTDSPYNKEFKECIPASIMLKKPVSFQSIIKVDPDLFPVEHIIKSCNNFYKNIVEDDLIYWKNSKLPFAKHIYDTYENIEANYLNLDNSCLIRLGFGSGLDFISLNQAKKKSYVSKKQNTGSDYNYKETKTRHLVSSKYPCGWAIMEFMQL